MRASLVFASALLVTGLAVTRGARRDQTAGPVVTQVVGGQPVAADEGKSFADDPRWQESSSFIVQSHPARIVGETSGPVTTLDDYPDCVAIERQGSPVGTGTLIGPNVVVTSGHLFIKGSENGGITNILVGINVQNPVAKVPVKKAIRHPDYQQRLPGDPGYPKISHDLAILILERELTGIRSRSLAPGEAIKGAKSIRAVGFGATNENGTLGFGTKNFAEIPIVSCACDGGLPDGTKDSDAYGCLLQRELVAEDRAHGNDTCRGDSGGPVYVLHHEVYYLAACTSRLTKKAKKKCGDGGIYVRIDQYEAWIRKTAQDNGGVIPPPPPSSAEHAADSKRTGSATRLILPSPRGLP